MPPFLGRRMYTFSPTLYFEGGWDRKCPLTILSLHFSDAFAAFFLVREARLERRLRSPSDGLHLPAFSTTSSSVMAVLYELHLRAKYTSKGVLWAKTSFGSSFKMRW